jgi:lipoprotein-anchoring transpeptidase ErfK/SrfK
MVRPLHVAVLVAALVLAGTGLALTASSRALEPSPGVPAPGATATRNLPPIVDAPAPATADAAAPANVRQVHRRPPSEVLRVRDGATVVLRSRPRGRVIARIGSRTEFGSPTALSVAARRGRWVGVPSPALGNGRLGWVDSRNGALDRRSTQVRLVVDLSKRMLVLRRRGRALRHVRVAIGRPGSSTPTGRFSITDKLTGSGYGPYYGCCILALSGHQPHPPPGWQGGSRIAIHGTNAPSSIGTPSSAGCLRAADADLRVLMRRVPLGTPVVIRG